MNSVAANEDEAKVKGGWKGLQTLSAEQKTAECPLATPCETVEGLGFRPPPAKLFRV
jgi:hypothetical protein